MSMENQELVDVAPELIDDKKITLADVRIAVGDSDPHSTNAGKIRSQLGGRGSYATIQRHLQTIRAEKIAAQQPVEAPVAPAIPEEFKALWVPVYTAAVSTVRARLDAVVAERDGLALTVETGKTDLAALEEIIEQHEQAAAEQAAGRAADAALIATHADQLAALASENEKVAAAHALELAERDRHASDVQHAHELAIAERERETESVKHAAELAQRDHQIGIEHMQREVDRLTTQIGDLRASLSMRDQALGAAQAAQAAAAAQAAQAPQVATTDVVKETK